MKFWIDLDKLRRGDGCLAFFYPATHRAAIERALQVQEPAKFKFMFGVERKRKPRTTGYKSQCAHLHGHLAQIANALGYTLGEIKQVMKEDMADWPRRFVKVGNVTKTAYMSESDADTVLEAKAIEWCHMRAAEDGIPLIESDGKVI